MTAWAFGFSAIAIATRMGWVDRLTGGAGERVSWRTTFATVGGAALVWLAVVVVLASCHAPLPKVWR